MRPLTPLVKVVLHLSWRLTVLLFSGQQRLGADLRPAASGPQ